MEANPARRYAVHGPLVEIDCQLPGLAEPLEQVLRPFAAGDWPAGFAPTSGVIRPYDAEQVMRTLSPTARPLSLGRELPELFEEQERFWLVDDRWGMCEMNLLKAQWRSWVLPNPRLDPIGCIEMSVLWPMAQLIRAKGVHLVPAVTAVRDGWAVLILCPFSLEAELDLMVRAGYKLIGQRWTALREEDGRIALMHVSMPTERTAGSRRLRLTTQESEPQSWFDLCAQYPGSWQNHAFCDAVLVTEPGRRSQSGLSEMDSAAASEVLRQAWSIAELHPQRRHSVLANRLGQLARCARGQLSRSPKEILDLLDVLRHAPRGQAQVGSCDAATARPGWASTHAEAA